MLYFSVQGGDRQVIQLKTHAPFVLFCVAEVPLLNTHCTIPYFEISHYQCKNKQSLPTSMYCLNVHIFSIFHLHWFTDSKELCGHSFKSRVVWKTPAYATPKILLMLKTVELKAVTANS